MSALALALLLQGSAASYVSLEATFQPAPKAGAPASIAVTFTSREPDVAVNQEPPPRLALDPAQTVLSLRPVPSAKPRAQDPEAAHYLEPAIPYGFPVDVKPGTAPGEHAVKGTVTYFYCSRTAGWCRKGSAPVEVSVTVR
jgi:hypothetical protein